MIIWAFLIFWAAGVRPDENGETVSLQTFQLGDDVFIKCFFRKNDMGNTMVWYKQRTGQIPQPIALSYNYNVKNILFEDEFKDGRLKVLASEDSFHLNITATTKEDIGKYYCGTVFLNKIVFISGAHLMLKGCESKDINLECDETEVVNGTLKNTDSNNQAVWDPVLLCLISFNIVLVMLIIAFLVDYFKRWRKQQKGSKNETSPSCEIENSDVNYAAVSFASALPARRSNNKHLTEYSEVNY